MTLTRIGATNDTTREGLNRRHEVASWNVTQSPSAARARNQRKRDFPQPGWRNRSRSLATTIRIPTAWKGIFNRGHTDDVSKMFLHKIIPRPTKKRHRIRSSRSSTHLRSYGYHTSSLLLRNNRNRPPLFFGSGANLGLLSGQPFSSASLLSRNMASKSYGSAHLCIGISPSLVHVVSME